MSKETRFKMALGDIDPNVRAALLYVVDLVQIKHREALSAIPQMQPNDNSAILVSIDSLQKQIDGLRLKVDTAYDHVQSHDEQEKHFKRMTKKIDVLLLQLKKIFEEQYKSGQYSEGTKRKIREDGLFDPEVWGEKVK